MSPLDLWSRWARSELCDGDVAQTVTTVPLLCRGMVLTAGWTNWEPIPLLQGLRAEP